MPRTYRPRAEHIIPRPLHALLQPDHEQLKKYPICFPVQKSCIEQAIKFYPKLIRGLDEYSRNGPRPAPAPAPDPDFGGPYHSRNHNPPPVDF